MSLSVLTSARDHRTDGSLAGSRVLLTGVSSRRGVALARAFGLEGAVVAVHSRASGADAEALKAALTPDTGAEPVFHTDEIADGAAAIGLVQRACAHAGRLDTVVNLIEVASLEAGGSADAAEAFVSRTLLSAVLMTRVAANRMSLLRRDGLVLNVVKVPAPQTRSQRALAGLLGAAFSAMTRGEARDWADRGIRINGVGPADALGFDAYDEPVADEDDLAYLATYLAGSKGKVLSGIVFADAPHPRCC